MRKSRGAVAFLVAAGFALVGTAQAANIGVSTLKYISIDKEAAAGKSKTVFVSKDALAKLSGDNDIENISVTIQAAYNSTTARFDIPAGSSDGTEGWLVVKDTVAKYVNKNAPGGTTGIKVAVIKPGKLLKGIGKTRGDSEILDLIGAGAPGGPVYTAYTVSETSETNSFCSSFPACSFKEIGGGTGRKLVCKGGVADGGCTAAGPPPTSHVYTFTVGPGGGVCGEVRTGGAAGVIEKTLTCGGLNIGGGKSTVPEGPTPDGAPSKFNASCGATSCSLTARTAAEEGGVTDSCSDTGCNFGTFLSISNGPLSTCVHNTFNTPGSGSLDLTTGAFNGSVPLQSLTSVTGNNAEPCPPCTAGLCNGTPAGPNNGGACVAVNAGGDTYDCPPGGSPLPPFLVGLTPIGSGTQVNATGPSFCPGQVTPGAFGCSTAPNLVVCPGASGADPDYIEARGTSTPLALGGAHTQRLASVFCIPKTGNALIDGAADLPGPGATTLPGTGSITP